MIIIRPNREINTKELSYSEGCTVKLWHKPPDERKANRLTIIDGSNEYEFFPSKGLSVGQVVIRGTSLFWEQPSDLIHPDTLNLRSEKIHINGIPAPGFMYIATYCAGIELLGLSNWGMPVQDNGTGRLEILHGEASCIPVDEVTVDINMEMILAEASFDFRTFQGSSSKAWYQRGEKMFRITRKVLITRASGYIEITDSFKNISTRTVTPDWGYHITFRPEPGAVYLVPASKAEPRGGGVLPNDYEVWQPSPDDKQRIEKGVIFKDLHYQSPGNFCTSLLEYPDGSGIAINTPPSPYFQTWFCSGGAGSKEFTWDNGEPVLKRNWNGMGIEFGSSALDHDKNTDPDVPPEPPLKPGESRSVSYKMGFISPDEALNLRESINRYIKGK
jgi:hypothetical protein